MLDAGDLQDMRAEMAASFPDSVEIRRGTPVPDGQGGETVTPGTVATVAGRLIATTRRIVVETEEGAKPVSITHWKALLPYGTSVLATDLLRIGGVEYAVVGTNEQASEALCLEVRLRKASG
jgi:hypothetical protein